jgi:hypothetical protein
MKIGAPFFPDVTRLVGGGAMRWKSQQDVGRPLLPSHSTTQVGRTLSNSDGRH